LSGEAFKEKYEELIFTLLDLSRLLESSGEWSESIRLLELGIDIVVDYPRLRARLLLPLAGLLWKRGDMPKAEALLSEIDVTAESFHDEAVLSDFYYQLGEIHYVKQFYMDDGESGEALPFHEKALELRLRLGDMEGASDSHSRVGTILERLGDWEQADQHYREAIDIAEETGYKRGLTRPLTHIGGYHRRRGEAQKALEHYREALRVSQETGDQEDIMFSLANVAQMLHRVNGDPEEALDHCRRALEIAERSGFKLAMARVHYGIALIHLREGCLDRAREHFQRVIEISDSVGYRFFIGPAEEHLRKI
jgi:tetratricopeptide (TPR) repeat protein